MRKGTLDDVIIKVSIGIGRTISESQTALLSTKKNKNEEGYNILVYSDNLKKDEINFEKKVELDELEKEVDEDIKILIKYKKDQGVYEDLQKIIERKSIDINTHSLRPYGLILKEREIPANPNTFYLFIDCDNMHDLNNEFGFRNVTEKINLIGKSLAKSIRYSERRAKENITEKENRSGMDRRKDGIVKDIIHYVTRYHGGAGDEFVVRVDCKDENAAVNVSERLIKSIYKAQEIQNKKNKERLTNK